MKILWKKNGKFFNPKKISSGNRDDKGGAEDGAIFNPYRSPKLLSNDPSQSISGGRLDTEAAQTTDID